MNKKTPEVFDLIIIGAGPGGITSAIYAGRQKLKTLVIGKEWGGQISKKAVAIENYPGYPKISGAELIKKFKDHLEEYINSSSVQYKTDSVIKLKKEKNYFFVSTSSGKEYRSIAVIIASGAGPRPLKVPGEAEFLGKGVSYCAVCDGFMFRNKTVAVIGGGNAGFEAALFLSKYVKKIYILEYSSKVKADKANQELVKKLGKVKIITNAQLKK